MKNETDGITFDSTRDDLLLKSAEGGPNTPERSWHLAYTGSKHWETMFRLEKMEEEILWRRQQVECYAELSNMLLQSDDDNVLTRCPSSDAINNLVRPRVLQVLNDYLILIY